jgi:protein subunit release factor A
VAEDCTERNQLQNKKKAFWKLLGKLADHYRSQIPERELKNDRVRTYHEKRNEVTDDRVPNKSYQYKSVLDGGLESVIKDVLLSQTTIEEISPRRSGSGE